MFKQAAFAALAASAFVALPASAATVTFGAMSPGGVVTLTPAGPGAVSSPISFDVEGTGDFTATFTFTNPFDPAIANGSASFNFDPDLLTFTSGTFGPGSTFAIGNAAGMGSSIQVDAPSLAGGPRFLTLTGTLNPTATPTGGNNFARVGGSITLTGAVPEPATWALFILGFGAIGHTMRRRSSKVRIAKASLTFA